MVRIKVTLYLEGGSKFSFYCSQFEMTKLSGTVDKREASWEGASRTMSIDLNKVIAFKIKNCIFRWF